MKKLISLILALIMCVSLFPVSVLADDEVIPDEPYVEEPAPVEEEPSVEEPAPEEEPPAEEPAPEEEPVPEEEPDAVALEEPDPLEDEPIITEKYFPDPFVRQTLLSYIDDNYGLFFTSEDGFTGAANLTAKQALKISRLDLGGSVDGSGNITGVSNTAGLARFFKNLTQLYMECSTVSSFNVKAFQNLGSSIFRITCSRASMSAARASQYCSSVTVRC